MNGNSPHNTPHLPPTLTIITRSLVYASATLDHFYRALELQPPEEFI